ncbi:type II secretion system secretin GspD [Pseudomonas sp. NPDC088368]|jgi:general secretion pathway protein D|uniref:type II secretion system secretin GspD n=1 Tax=Pseudomonas sp. NPDC088368 TaxID=3364453 RepID=UPI00381DEA20
MKNLSATPGWCKWLLCSILLLPGFNLPHVAVASESTWQLAMNDADLRDVVREMSVILGATVVLDPRVQGRITVMSEQALDREAVRRLFYSVLDAHHFTVIDQGERILIIPVAEGKTRASGADTHTARNEQFVTQVFALNDSSAAELSTLLRPLVSANGYVGPSASNNALVVTDTAGNVRRVKAIISQLDTGQHHGHSVVQLQHALAGPLARVIEQSMGKQAAESATLVIPDVRHNRLVLMGSAAVRQRLSALTRALDTPAAASSDNARVIRLRHSDAQQLAEVLDGIGPGHAGESGIASEQKATVKSDESQNALVMIAEPSHLRTLEQVVQQLDQPRAQVLIHAAIIEVSGDIANALGVQWGAQRGGGLGAINFPGAGIGLPGLRSDDVSLPDGAFLQVGNDRFGVLINALASDTRNNVLSTPSLLTLDNQEAEILVGQNVPFKSGSYQTPGSGSENPYTTVTRQDIGIKLKIRPHINDGETLRLEVEQENSEIAGSVEGLNDLVINKRSLKSAILANDGQVIVIGGLIKDNVRTRESGVPLLRSIPWLGGLFRWTSDTREKTNLMIFLRPTIVRGNEGLTALTDDRYQLLRNLGDGKGDNSLLVPRDVKQLFDHRPDAPVIDVRSDAGGRP